jgi:hypothetical protein
VVVETSLRVIRSPDGVLVDNQDCHQSGSITNTPNIIKANFCPQFSLKCQCFHTICLVLNFSVRYDVIDSAT